MTLPADDDAQAEEPATGPDFRPLAVVQLAVADLDRSIAFYGDVLGLQLELRNESLRWAKFHTAVPGLTIGVGESDDVAGSGTTSINLSVADTDTARALLESRGVEFLGPTVNIPGVVRLADLLDPDGNTIRIAGPARP